MKVPLLDLKAQYSTIRSEIGEAIERVVESQHFILGPEVEGLEREIAAFCKARFAIGVSSGTDALLAALMAIGTGPGRRSDHYCLLVLCHCRRDRKARRPPGVCGYRSKNFQPRQ